MKLMGKPAGDARAALERGDVTIAVYGIGKLGLPLAAVFADRGARVIGVDVNKALVADVNAARNALPNEPGVHELLQKNVRAGRLRATADGAAAAREADVLIVLVPTLVRERGARVEADLGTVQRVARTIARGLQRDSLVVTECTMPPGATESLIPVLEKSGLRAGMDFGLAHAPERTSSGTTLRDITRQYPKILGALNPETLEPLRGLYEAINEKGVLAAPDVRTAEAVKVFEGIYRDVNIALANELAKASKRLEIDAVGAFRLANTQPYCHLHAPGVGVGGHCIPVYPHFVMGPDTPLLRAARKTNDDMPAFTAGLVWEALAEAGRPVRGARVLVLGLTFRGGVREYRHTPAKPLIAALKKQGARVFAFDPLSTRGDARKLGAAWSPFSFKGFDAVVIATDDAAFRALDVKKMKRELRTPVLVDGRQVVDPVAARAAGLVYRGVGRL